MNKRQINFILGGVIVGISIFAYLFSSDSSRLISFGNKNVTPSKDVYQKEVIGESTGVTNIPVSSPEVTVIPSGSPGDNSQISQDDSIRDTYHVVHVVDGDTLDVSIDGAKERIRIIGIDTPETVDPRKPVQCFGIEASNKAKEILNGQSVSLEADVTQGDKDKYGRLLRYVFLPDGTNYGLFMISEGYAHEYTYHLPYKYQSEYKQAEVDARNNNRGLWSPDTCNGNK